jgi:hypothetical protein
MSVVHVVVDHLSLSEHSDAYFALVGALGGAVVVGFLGLVGQRMQSRSESGRLERHLEHDRAERDRNEQRARMVAARLVYDELQWVSGVLGSALDGTVMQVREILADKALVDVWREQRAVLGGEMKDDAWRRVSMAVERTRLSTGASGELTRESMEEWLTMTNDALIDLWLIAFPRKPEEKLKDPAEEWQKLRTALQREALDAPKPTSGDAQARESDSGAP